MAGLGGSTSATVITIILAFRKEHEMLKEVEKAKGASSTRRHNLQPLAELCQIRIRFDADGSFIASCFKTR